MIVIQFLISLELCKEGTIEVIRLYFWNFDFIHSFSIMSTSGVFSFPILSDREILDTMDQIKIPLESKDLTNPESKKVVSTFINLMSASTGISTDELSVYDKENAKKYNLEGNQHLLSVITAFGPL